MVAAEPSSAMDLAEEEDVCRSEMMSCDHAHAFLARAAVSGLTFEDVLNDIEERKRTDTYAQRGGIPTDPFGESHTNAENASAKLAPAHGGN